MKKNVYKENLNIARQELVKLLEQREALDKRIAKLRQEIGSLAYLAGVGRPKAVLKLPGGAKKQSGLKPACREVLRASDVPLTPDEVMEGIGRLGFHQGNYTNLLASVHTTLRRMTENGEVEESSKGGKKAYRLKVNRPLLGGTATKG